MMMNTDDDDNSGNYPMGPIKPHRRKAKKNVKGLFACKTCGQDYTN